ncbi:peptidoglycan-binding protein [Methylobacterium sp. CB376]|uniref:peptidoglycan-binding protein n=1 Tax=Methylobacterium sp. CB376 TaxID=3138063 RepID=UPI0024B27C3E|nr:peptidoglycan-binding protein [Methylobacterium nodulans]WFT80763.1 peptidoglycan-binding protein [Methylobacterium nodulans]
MTAELRRGVALAGIGLVSGIVLIGIVSSGNRMLSTRDAPEPAAPGAAAEQQAALAPPPAPPSAPPSALPSTWPPSAAPRAPSFDVIRVEPTGESVVAGRAAPEAQVELLRDGEVFARTQADASGQFVLVPPALPPGSHAIGLRSVAPDGTRTTGPESAVVAVAANAASKPLVAVSAPGQPTTVLSQPEEAPKPAPSVVAAAREAPAAPPPGTTPIRIASVDAETGGKLFVSAQGAPQTNVRLYLNETLIAPGRTGSDGRVAFSIGRGVRPGDYRVRIDQVDPATGSVRTRSEVKFAVPPSVEAAPVVAAARPAPAGPPKPAGHPAPSPAAAPAPPAPRPRPSTRRSRPRDPPPSPPPGRPPGGYRTPPRCS